MELGGRSECEFTSLFFLQLGLNSISAASAKDDGELSSVRPTDILSRKSQLDLTVKSNQRATHKKACTMEAVTICKQQNVRQQVF